MTGYSQHLNPGSVEVFFGSMKSGKTTAMLDRASRLAHVGVEYLLCRPEGSKREEKLTNRLRENDFPWVELPPENPEHLFEKGYLSPQHGVVGIDEIQLFCPKIVRVVQDLTGLGINVLAAGLPLDFRGEPFGSMPQLMALSHPYLLHPQVAVCEVEGCREDATRTQRLIGSDPAPYDDLLVRIGDDSTVDAPHISYQARCARHHVVPGVPRTSFAITSR